MKFACPTCAVMMQCLDADAGKKIFCVQCGQKILVPTPINKSPQTNKTTLGKLEDDEIVESELVPQIKSSHSASPPTETPFVKPDQEPNRGVTIMVLGIISCVCCFVAVIFGSVFGPFALLAIAAIPTGIIAWRMGHIEREKINEGIVSNENPTFVLTGYICGIVGTSLSISLLVLCAAANLLCLAILAKIGFFHAF